MSSTVLSAAATPAVLKVCIGIALLYVARKLHVGRVVVRWLQGRD